MAQSRSQQSEQSQQAQLSPKQRLIAMLVDKISQDSFPSVTMMDFVEENLTPEQREQYLHVLLDKVEEDRFPSLEIMRRVERLT